MSQTYALVREFHRIFGLPIAERAEVPPVTVQAVRLHLIGEENSELYMGLAKGDLIETLDALTDLQYVVDGAYVVTGIDPLLPPLEVRNPDWPSDIMSESVRAGGMNFAAKIYAELSRIGIQWALKDLMKATIHLNDLQMHVWRCVEYLGLERVRIPALQEVHASNLSKLDENGKPIVNEVGRTGKGPNYRPPDLRKILLAAYPGIIL